MLDEPEIEAKPDAKGHECPTCGDRFPSQETLEEHTKEEHKLTG
jgi:C2H2-type zinc finger protein